MGGRETRVSFSRGHMYVAGTLAGNLWTPLGARHVLVLLLFTVTSRKWIVLSFTVVFLGAPERWPVCFTVGTAVRLPDRSDNPPADAPPPGSRPLGNAGVLLDCAVDRRRNAPAPVIAERAMLWESSFLVALVERCNWHTKTSALLF